MPSLILFTLRKDLLNRKQQNSAIVTINAAKTNARNNAIARNYVNSLLSTDVKVETEITNFVKKTEVETLVTEIVTHNTIDNSKLEEVNKSINDAIDLLNSEKNKMLLDINNAISNLNTTLTQTINTNNTYLENKVQDSFLLIENKTQESINSINALSANVNTFNESLDGALLSISAGKIAALNEIRANVDNAVARINLNNDEAVNIKTELLEKINYIFEMFFHANSEFIMNNYPL